MTYELTQADGTQLALVEASCREEAQVIALNLLEDDLQVEGIVVLVEEVTSLAVDVCW